MEKAKSDIQILIKGIKKNDINACFFNAKCYLNYINYLNYFSDIDQLFKIERKNYLRNQFNLYNSWTSLTNFGHDTNFISYINKKLNDKIKNDLKKTLPKNQIINKNIETKVNQNIEELINYNININNCPDKNKKKNFLIKVLSFAEGNIQNFKTNNCTDVENFCKVFNNQINFINITIQEEVKLEICDTIEILDMYFKRDFSERNRELTEVQKFKIKLNDLEKQLNDLFENLNIEKIVEKQRQNITESLEDKKKDFSKILENKKYDDVLKEIKTEFNNSLKYFNTELNKKLDKIGEESLNIDKEIKKTLNSFIKRTDLRLNPLKNLKEQISKNIGDPNKNLSDELYNELENSCEGLYNIWKRKDFKDWIFSLCSNEKYLTIVTDMMVETFIAKLEYLSNLINEKCHLYKSKILTWMKNVQKSSLFEFNESESKKWKQLCISYENTKQNIKDAGFL